jgi:hypothetical protein
MKAISHSLLVLMMLVPSLRSGSVRQTPVPIEFQNYEVINEFPQSLTFKIEICNVPENSNIYLYYKIAQSSWEFSNDWVFSDGLTEDGCQRRRKEIITKNEPPMLDIQYYWLVRMKEGQAKGPVQKYLYADPRFEWHVLQNKDVAVHWHDRPEEFGKTIFDIAVHSIAQQRELYGAELEYPAQIVIQNTDAEFMSWQLNPDPDTGGLALPWYGITVQVVADDSKDWLNEVLPHEISHLYFYQVTIYSRIWPPSWVDEGLAVYYEFGDHEFEDHLVRDAVLQARLIPLLALREGFGFEDHPVDLAYAESYYVAVYILEVYGREKLAQLLQEYNRGKDHDEAFMSAFNRPLDQFEQDWEEWVETKFRVIVPAATAPLPVEESRTPYPNVFGILMILCCFFAAGVSGLGFLVVLLKSTAKKTAS